MKQEIWKPIKDFDGQYLISNQGRLKSLRTIRVHGNRKLTQFKEKVMNPSKSKAGYCYATLSDRKKYLIHRLVAAAFLSPIPGKECVNHKDCNKSNNTISNLEYCTPKENTQHLIESGYSFKGSSSPSSKLHEKDIITIFNLRSKGRTYQQIASIFNVDQSLIGKIITRKLWSHVKLASVLILIIMSSFSSFAQNGSDTITCYNNKDLKRIATRVVRAHECDTLLKIAEKKISNQQQQLEGLYTALEVKNQMLITKDGIIGDCKKINTLKDSQIEDRDKKIKKLGRKLKWTKAAWYTTTGLLAALFIFGS